MLELTGPTVTSYSLDDSGMMPTPFRCELKYKHYDYKGREEGVQEIWRPENKFDSLKNCFYDKGGKYSSQNCMHTDSFRIEGL